MDGRSRVARWYQNTALLLLNFFVFLVVANVGLYVLFRVKDGRSARGAVEEIARIHENPSLHAVYPDLDAESVHQLVRETWSRPYEYEPFTQFKERPYRGRFVNVSEAGFRLSRDQGPWPPDPENFNVFLFGGSTAFGYGVPDDETVASYLQGYLRESAAPRACVYNFGRSSYISEQERVLLEELLVDGFVPNLAVFMDGLNEFAFPNGPVETQRLKAIFESGDGHAQRWAWIQALPMTRLAQHAHRLALARTHRHPGRDPRNAAPVAAIDDGKYHDSKMISGVIARYFANKTLIESAAHAWGARVAFVWQPIPLYKYDLSYHLFATDDFGSNFFARYGYLYMEDHIRKEPPGDDFLWCADIQEALHEPLYVDKVHYTARMSKLVASTIGEKMLQRGLLEAPAGVHARGGSR